VLGVVLLANGLRDTAAFGHLDARALGPLPNRSEVRAGVGSLVERRLRFGPFETLDAASMYGFSAVSSAARFFFPKSTV
jgi:hypothetical protein